MDKLIKRLRQPGQRERDVVITADGIREIISNNRACQQARQTVQDTCYKNNPDPRGTHQNEMRNLRNSHTICQDKLAGM
jgi:hypothetical protein